MRHRDGAETLVIKRRGALGDVLMTTPVAAALHRAGRTVAIDTENFLAYEGSPHAVVRRGSATNLAIDLDLAYERRPDLHAVDAFFLAAGVSGDRTIQYFPRLPQPKRAPYIAVHAAKSWASRTFHDAFWRDVAARMPLPVVWIGSGSDMCFGESRMNIGLPATASVIEDAAAVVCSDSALLHLAGATETPIVGLFTCVRADRRMPYRHGSMGWRAMGLEAQIECRGCLETEMIPTTDLVCRRQDNACVRSIDPAEVARAVGELLSGQP